MSIFKIFQQVTDKRNSRGKMYPLYSVLSLILLSKLLGLCGNRAASRLYNMLNTSDKVFLGFRKITAKLTHVTVGNILKTIDIKSLEKVLGGYMQAQIDRDAICQVSIDGKTLRGSKTGGNTAKHALSLFCNKISGVIGQQLSNVGGGEISSAIELLSTIDLQGLVITGDAMFCNEQICQQIIDNKGDYILTVKNNQPQLLKEIEQAFDDEKYNSAPRYYQQPIDKKHGRIEQRSITVIDMPWEYNEGWSTIKQIAKIDRYRFDGEKESDSAVYLIISLEKEKANAKKLIELNRGHWSIENKLHYIRDVVFREDHSTIRKNNAPQANAALNSLAVHLCKKVHNSVTVAIQQHVCRGNNISLLMRANI